MSNFRHLFKSNLSDVCSHVTNPGLSPSAWVTAKAIEKTLQSTWFDCCYTGCTLTGILLVAGRISGVKILEEYFHYLENREN